MSLKYEPALEPLHISEGSSQLDPIEHLFLDGIIIFREMSTPPAARKFFIDNLLVRIHFIIVMIRWTGLASGEFQFPFPGSLTSTFLAPPPK